MARGKDWKQAKVSKVEGFKNVNRAQQYTPVPSAYGQGGESFINNIQGTEQQDSTFGFGGPPSPSDRTSIISSNDPMEPTSIQSQNATNARDDISIVTGGGGSSMQNDITVANVTQTEPRTDQISFADVQSGAATTGYTPGIDQPDRTQRETIQVDYNVPGGATRTADVQTWKEGDTYYSQYGEYGDSMMASDAKPNADDNYSNQRFWVQAETQKGMGETDWNALDPTSKANKGEGIAINRGGVDMFFGAKEEKRGAIEGAFKEQDFNKLWSGVKSNIGTSMGLHKRGYDYFGDPTGEGVWDKGQDQPFANYGQKSQSTDMSKIFGFYKDKHKKLGNKKIVNEITAMENRWTIGGKAKTSKGGGGATSGLFGFNNKGPQSSDGKNNPLSFYEDLNNKTKNQKFYDM